MEPLSDTRWRQRFENFEKSYKLLEKYSSQELTNDLEKAGIIQFFEMTFELAWKVLRDYLQTQGYPVKSPREAIKQAYQIDLINDGHIWLDALSKRNLTTYTYDKELAEKLVQEIKNLYFPELKSLYELLGER